MKKMAFHKAVSIVSGLALAITSLMPGNFALAETSQGDVPPCGTVNFVDNSSFETPVVTNPANWDIYPGDGVAVPNWKADWNGTFEGAPKPANIELQKFPLNNWTAQDGQQWTELDTDWGGPGDSQNGEPASIKLYQDVSVTYGARYTLSFYTSPRPGTGQDDNITKIEWGGTTLDTITEDGSLLTTPDWKLHTYTVTATAAPMMLAFTDMGTPNSLGGFLDNVTLKQVCVPQNCNFEQKSGWYGEYFNYPSNHPDMNLDPSFWPDKTHGDPMGNVPWTADWYTDPYMRFTQVDPSLTFGDNFFPFDSAPEEIDNGHDYHFGAHWAAKVTAPAGAHAFTLTSDDDAWVYLDGVLQSDNSGIHPPQTVTSSMTFGGTYIVDIYFAERHVVQSYMSFNFNEELVIVPYNRDCVQPVPKLSLEKTGVYTPTTGQIDYSINWNVIGEGTLSNVTITDTVPTGTTFVSASAPGTESGGVVTWLLGPKTAPAGGTVHMIVSVDSYEPWADDWSDFNQGKRKDGTNVLPVRSDPSQAVGPAVDHWTDPVTFVSLGFGGSIVLSFNNYILNGTGADIEVVETSYGPGNNPSDTDYPEKVELFVSQNGSTWVSLGTGIQDETFAFEDGNGGSTILPWAQYVKLVDVSDKTDPHFPNDADGYDVDGVQALHSAPSECSLDNSAHITGTAYDGQVVTANAEVTLTLNQNACTGTIKGYKFNDQNDNHEWGKDEPGLEGWTIKAVLPTPVAAVTVPSTDPNGITTSTLPNGKYLAVVMGTWQGAAGTNNMVDAEYVTHDTWATHKDGTDGEYPGGGVDQGDLMVGSSFLDWGPYSSNHAYYRNIGLEEPGTFNFSVFDGDATTHTKIPAWYGDNVGILTVTLYAVVDETITGSDGGYQLTIPPQYPNVWVFELPQRGWQQTAPESVYYDVNLSSDKIHEGLNFGNHGLGGSISGMKFNDKDGDSDRDDGDNGLAEWTIYASKHIQTIKVEAWNDIPTSPEFWTNELTAGKEYILRVAGTYDANDYITADAKYSMRSVNGPDWTDIVKNYESYGPTLLDLFVDNDSPNWGVYNPSHVYWQTITGTGAEVKLQIYEIYAQNDSGFLTVDVYEVIDKQITDDNGNYHFTFLEVIGEVMISEQTKDGWLETLPTPEGYYLVSTDKNYTDKDFGNHYTVQLPGSVTGMKFNDHNNDGVKDENDGGLVGWKIYAGQLLDTLEVDSYYEDPELPALTHSNFVLENGQKYFLRVSQTFLAGDSITADTKYSIRTGPDWTDIVENYGGYEPGLLEIWMDSALVNWGAFNSSNVYWHTVVGNGNPLYFYIKDIYPINNSGKLKVEIFKVLAETTTVADGSYNLVLPDELSGNVVVAEETQTGWTQTYLMPLGYYTVSADGVTEDINFGNHQLVEEQGGEGGDNGDNGGVTGQGSSGGGGSYYNPGGGTTPPVVTNPNEGVGGGEVAGEETINPVAGNPTAGGGRRVALKTGDQGNVQDQGDVLGETETATDDQNSNDQAGSGWWRVAAYIMIPLLLILLIIYGIYRWMNRGKGKPTGGTM